jgi:hypothetical protein
MSENTAQAKQATFTPGPWQRAGRIDGEELVVDQDTKFVAIIDWRGDSLIQGANARLIAAAPEMYWALKQALEFIRITSDQGPELHQTTWEKQYAAIAKAEGCNA